MISPYLKYADAFVDLARDKNKVEDYLKDVNLILDIFNSVDKLDNFLKYESVSKIDKKNLVIKSFKESINKDVLNFILLLIDKGHIDHYLEIFNSIKVLCNQELNMEEGYIFSKRPIDDEDLIKIQNRLSSDDKKIILERKIDDSLISGFRIVLNNKIIDYSMKQKIEDLRLYLLKEGA